MHGAANALKKQTEFMCWMFRGINTDTVSSADLLGENSVSKKGTLKSLSDLLKWADKYQKSNLAEIRKILKAFPEKVVKT